MRQTELHLTAEDRAAVDAIRSKGLHKSREINRAHVLSSLDQGISEVQIMAVLGMGRTAVWRTRAAYIEGGVALAVFDMARPGRPRHYGMDEEARVISLARSAPPEGHRRWTIAALERAVRQETGMARVTRDMVRRMLRKVESTSDSS